MREQLKMATTKMFPAIAAPISAALAWMLLISVFISNANAALFQVAPRNAFPRVIIRADGLVNVNQNANANQNEQNEDITYDQATLKTDPDLEALMEKADRYRSDGNYRVASTLWQAVLQRSGDALYSEDEQIYFSLVQRVERVLADLPPEGLEAYRITADAEAKEILNRQPAHDVTALATVVQRYFVSSIGDDAAYELGSIFLDRFDFSGARRLFEKIATEYPDPSVPLDQVWLKVALCHSWLGNSNEAQIALEKSKQLSASGDGPRHVDLVSRSIGTLSFESAATEISSVWKSVLGNETRVAVMPAPPKSFVENDLAALWQYYYEPKNTKSDRRDFMGSVRAGAASYSVRNSQTCNTVERKLIDSWSKKDWRPGGDLLFDESRIYFRSVADMTAWNKEDIERQIQTTLGLPEDQKNQARDPFKKSGPEETWQALAWRSVWRNGFEIDEKTTLTRRQLGRWGGYNNRNIKNGSPDPQSLPEVQLFGDKIASNVSLHQEVVYVVEGPKFDDRNRVSQQKFGGFRNMTTRRVRSNYLTAYDRVSGMVLWSLPEQAAQKASPFENDDEEPVAEADSNEFIAGGGFMAAPIGYGNLIIAPVNTGGAISVYALDPANGGKTVWKSYLCDEPETSADAWSPIALSIDGSDLFVNCGMGVSFVLDPASGAVRFARRYSRDGEVNPFARARAFNVPRYKQFDGWSQDVIIPYGKQMVCFSSDRKVIEACDRSSGELLWRADINPVFGGQVDYVIGVYDDVLYAGGFETMIAYSLKNDGQILWGGKTLFENEKSRGRAMLTPDGIFVPVEQSILQFALDADEQGAPQLLRRTNVTLGTNAPVGNLYSDGDRIWVHGGNRLYALGPKPK